MENSDNKKDKVSPFSIPNIRRFIAFKVFFNSRFYYPVFTILFLDFGLTVAEFSILNAVWAATIVTFEVPSGALADSIGRKRLLVFATLTMILEISLIAFIPTGNKNLIFWVFLINRVLSGLAEAAASGADEALAYDALKEKGDEKDWGRVLEVMTRFQSIGFIVTMTIGAVIYDPDTMEKLLSFLGFNFDLTQKDTLKLPLYGTLVLAFLAFYATVGMKEIVQEKRDNGELSGFAELKSTLLITFKAGKWILQTPFVLSVILFGMLFDSTIRMVITLSSQYYRMIELPESIFGIIGASVSMLGLVIPKIARKIAEERSAVFAMWVTAILSIIGLVSMNFFIPYAGIIPAIITFGAMYFNGFFVSYYVNRETSSDKRATVLSFKGLSYNVVYGLFGMLYALVLKIGRETNGHGLTGKALENAVFKDSFYIFPGIFLAGFAILLAISIFYLKPMKKR